MDKFTERQEVLRLLNAPDPEERLANLAIIIGGEKQHPEVKPQYANNHIHTIYSFSPYSPAAAVYCARDEGLQTAGIMDHDTIAGAVEFRKAGKIAGIGTTCGMECRGAGSVGAAFVSRCPCGAVRSALPYSAGSTRVSCGKYSSTLRQVQSAIPHAARPFPAAGCPEKGVAFHRAGHVCQLFLFL